MELREFVSHLLPREIIGPVLIIFSLQGILDNFFELYTSPHSTLLAWVIIFLICLLVISVWGEQDPTKAFE